MPFIHKHVAIMPDVHWGMGATVGSVIPTKGAIIPAAVGVDIGCGMMAQRTSLTASDLPDNLHGLRTSHRGRIPHGRTDNGGPATAARGATCPTASALFGGIMRRRPGAKIVAKHPKLGAGRRARAASPRHARHRQPLRRGLPGRRGSRLGHAALRLARHRQPHRLLLHRAAKQDMRRWFINLPDQDLAYFPQGSELFGDYMGRGVGAEVRRAQPPT
jgi:tRNA-splicing ligase RtcB